MGLNDDTSFEEALHLAAPSCCFRGYDGSLKGVVHGKNRSTLTVRLPQFLRLAACGGAVRRCAAPSAAARALRAAPPGRYAPSALRAHPVTNTEKKPEEAVIS